MLAVLSLWFDTTLSSSLHHHIYMKESRVKDHVVRTSYVAGTFASKTRERTWVPFPWWLGFEHDVWVPDWISKTLPWEQSDEDVSSVRFSMICSIRLRPLRIHMLDLFHVFQLLPLRRLVRLWAWFWTKRPIRHRTLVCCVQETILQSRWVFLQKLVLEHVIHKIQHFHTLGFDLQRPSLVPFDVLPLLKIMWIYSTKILSVLVSSLPSFDSESSRTKRSWIFEI